MTSADPPGPGGPPARSPTRSSVRRIVTVGGWACLAGALGAWAVLRAGDVWAPATVATFAPLHVLTLPVAALLVVAVAYRRRALRTLVPAMLLTAGPVAGFCVPWGRLTPDPLPGPALRVLTCNMHYSRTPAGPLDRLVDATAAEVVVLQEWRDSSRSDVLVEPRWHVRREPGQFLASRYPIRRADRLGSNSVRDRGSISRYELETPAGVVTLFSVHLASPRDGLEDVARVNSGALAEVAANSELRWTQSRYLAAEADRVGGSVLIVGDFNTPPQSALFRRVWHAYEDAFASAGWGWGHTFSTRRAAVRIDHVLVGGGGQALRCWVGPDVGSPHRPVLADVAWPTRGFVQP